MKTAKKSLISIFVAMFLLMSTGFCLTVALADDVQPTAPAIEVTLEQKASVRIDEPYGIKFKAQVNAEELTAYYGQDSVIFGMLICPADFVTEAKPLKIGVEGGLTEYNPADGGTVGADTYVNRTATPDEKGEYYCNLIDIKENNLSRPYMAVAYVGIVDGEDVTYTYSETFSRSIYTVAAYTLAGDALLESTDTNKLDANATTYLTNVVNKVQETYDDLVVTASKTTFDGDNAFTVQSATVSNGTRTLETCVVLSSDNITRTDLTAYKATKVGEFSVTASVGNLSETITGFNCKTVVLDIPTQLVNGTSGAQKPTFTKQTTAVGGYSKDVYSWADYYNLKVSSEIQAQMKAGVYLYVDLYSLGNQGSDWSGFVMLFQDNASSSYNLYSSEGDDGAITFDGVVDYRLLDEYNVHLSKNIGKVSKQWVTAEFKMLSDLSSGRVGFYLAAWTDNGFYIKNVRISTEQAKPVSNVTTILNSQADFNACNVTARTDKVALSWEVNDITGTAGAVKWSSVDSNAKDADAIVQFSSKFATSCVKGSYFYFDIYVKNAFALKFNEWEDILLYNSVSNNIVDYIKFYNENSQQITSGSFWGGSFNGQWITIEICLQKSDLCNTNSIYRGLSVTNTTSLPNNEVYLRNIKVSNIPLEFSSFNDANA